MSVVAASSLTRGAHRCDRIIRMTSLTKSDVPAERVAARNVKRFYLVKMRCSDWMKSVTKFNGTPRLGERYTNRQ